MKHRPRRHGSPSSTPGIELLGVGPGSLLLLAAASVLAPREGAAAFIDPSALERALAQAGAAATNNEVQIAQSSYRSALLEGWLSLGALEGAEGNLQEAKRSFERAASAAVETRRARTALATVQLRLGEVREAVVLLRSLAGERPSDLPTRRLLAQALAANDQLEEAVQELEELRALAPEDAENLYLLATANLSRGSLETAESLFAELAAQRPSPQTQVLIGRTLRDFGHLGPARAALLAAVEMDPGIRRAHYYLATIDLKDRGWGLLEQAVIHLEAELEIAPEDPMTNLYLGIARVEQRRHREALAPLEIAARSTGLRSDAFQFLGRSLLALERPAEAMEALRSGLEAATRSTEKTEETEETLRANSSGALDVEERRLSSLHYQLALALRRIGEEHEAADHFDAAKRHSSRSIESSREILDHYLARDARTLVLQPTVFSSPWQLPWLSGLDSQERLGLKSRIQHGLAQAYYNLGVLQMRSQRPQRAAVLFERANALEPDFPRLQYSLGVAYFSGGQFQHATVPLALALEADPSDANLRRMLALSHLNAESYPEAARLLRDDEERHTNPSLQYAYALALVRSGRAAEAQPVFASMLTDHADWPELNVVLGQAYAQEGDFAAAIATFQRAIELRPDVADAHAALGDIYLRQGRLEEAEEALRAELRHHPDGQGARYVLATVLDLNRKPDEALQLLRALLVETPDFTNARYLLGKVLLQQGEAENARTQLEAASALSPDDPNIRYQLARAYQQLGLTDAAQREFELFQRLKKRSEDPSR